MVVDVGGMNIYIFADGQVVSSRDPLSAQVGDRRIAAIAFSSLYCNLYGSM